MRDDIKLIIGIPTIGTINWMFARDLMTLQVPDKTRVIWQIRAMIDTARNNLIEYFLNEADATHMLMIDDDMTFEPDFAINLLENDVDIVGGLAFKRRPHYEPCVYQKNENGDHIPILPKIYQEVDAIGTGGLLIKRKVFQEVMFPWFETGYDDNKIHWSVDFNFCKKAKSKGFKIFVEPLAQMGHIGDPEVVTQETFLKHIVELKNLKAKENDTSTN